MSLFETERIPNSFLIEIKRILNEDETKKRLTEFLEDPGTRVLYAQVFQVSGQETPSLHFNTHNSFEQVKQENIDLCVLLKKTASSLNENTFSDSVSIHRFCGMLDRNVGLALLNSLKPMLENMFLHSELGQEFLGDIMRSYSDYEFSLMQLKRSESVKMVSLNVHTQVEELCANPNWETHLSEFKQRLDDRVLKEIYNCLLGWSAEIQHVLQHDMDPFDAEGCLTEHAFWKNKDAALKSVIDTFRSPPALVSLGLLEESSYRALTERLTSILISDKFLSSARTYSFLNTLNLVDIIKAISLDELIFSARTILSALEQHGVANYPIERLSLIHI